MSATDNLGKLFLSDSDLVLKLSVKKIQNMVYISRSSEPPLPLEFISQIHCLKLIHSIFIKQNNLIFSFD